MKTYLQLGDNITLPSPRAVASGAGALIGAIFGVASTDAAQGEEVSFVRVGVFILPKATGAAWTPGQKLYWDNTAFNVTTSASSTTPIGAAAAAAGSADASGNVLLTGQVA
jgi:predicted RecA/RadA family phage recombinase